MTDLALNARRDWPHAPPHWFVPNCNYMLTGSTLNKLRLFNSPEKLSYLQSFFLRHAALYGWTVQAWAFMPNHYHVIATSPNDADNLGEMMKLIHSSMAKWLNETDQTPGRQVWYQYWDTCLTYQNSYLARLNYVCQNPVKHGLARHAEEYKWCSMNWFKENAATSFQKTVFGFKIDKIKVFDDFD